VRPQRATIVRSKTTSIAAQNREKKRADSLGPLGCIVSAQAYFGTVSETVVFLLRLPNVPVMVMADLPAAAPSLTVRVNVLVVVVGLVLNDAVTPVGIPVAARVTS
jgi:hypothetical protein